MASPPTPLPKPSERDWIARVKNKILRAPEKEDPAAELAKVKAENDPVKKIIACEAFLKKFKGGEERKEVLQLYANRDARIARIRACDESKRMKLCEAFLHQFPEKGKQYDLVQELYDASASARLKRIEDIKDPAARASMCSAYLERYPQENKIRAKVEQLHLEAVQAAAKQAYLLPMQKGADKKFQHLGQEEYVMQELKEAPKVELEDPKKPLSEDEIRAFRVFTTNNYLMINPAVANQKDKLEKAGQPDWMDKNKMPNPDKAETPEERQKMAAQLKAYQDGGKRAMQQEGALHAGVLMLACKKLRPKQGVVYRGQRMTAKRFQDEFSMGKTITFEAFVSSATDRDSARKFARGEGDIRPGPGETVSVFCETEVMTARDIMGVSVQGNREKEWLILPGTQVVVASIEDDKVKEPGREPFATEWKLVRLKEIVKK